MTCRVLFWGAEGTWLTNAMSWSGLQKILTFFLAFFSVPVVSLFVGFPVAVFAWNERTDLDHR
ncbi:MAG: hypothetical protein OES46_00420 [Gammaproteobacteria bacterium]|jgi:hypothetical protein|nr:hypothetical protein [Gammaproteobacteria bacterium]